MFTLVSRILPKDIIKVIANLVYFDTNTYDIPVKHKLDIMSSMVFEYDSYGRIKYTHKCDIIEKQHQTIIELHELERYNSHSRFAYHMSCWLICGKPINGMILPYKENEYKTTYSYVGSTYILKTKPEIYWMFDDPLVSGLNRTRIVFAYMKSKSGYNKLQPRKYYKLLIKKRKEID